MRIKRYDRTPENIGKLWGKFHEHRHKFLLGTGDDVDRYIQWACAPNTAIYECGDFWGVYYLTEIFKPRPPALGECTAYLHIFLWDRKAFGQWRALRASIPSAMEELGTDRWYSANVDGKSKLAEKMLFRMSFRKVGVIKKMQGLIKEEVDMALYELRRADMSGEET